MRQDSAITGSSAAASRAKSAFRSCAVRSNSGRLAMTPYFTTSYRPALNSRRGSVAQQLRVDDDGRRRMECADEILAERVVHADLAADRAVHLRQQRRRHLHDGDAAEVRGRGKTGDVADHAAADGDDRADAVRAGANQRVVDLARPWPAACSARRRECRIGSSRRDPVQTVAVEAPHRLARDHEAPGRHAGARRAARRAASRHRAQSRCAYSPEDVRTFSRTGVDETRELMVGAMVG